MKRFSKRIRCTQCGKTHYAKPSTSTPGRAYAVCPRCGQETLIERNKAAVVTVAGKTT